MVQNLRDEKKTISLFKGEGLSIKIDTNVIEADFLDASFNSNTGKYFLSKNQITHLYTYIQNPTTHRQLLRNCHQ